MFFIVNKTKQTVIIGDLGVTLGPRQAVDLDKTVGRAKADASKSLKQAKKGGQIEVRIKDGEKPPSPARKAPPPEPSLDNFKNEIIDEMKGSIKALSRELVAQQPVNSGDNISSKDLDALAKKIIKSMPISSETIIFQEKQARTDEEVEIDEGKLSEISARAVNEIVKDTEIKSIHYKEEKQENTILDNVDELEDLIG